MFAWGMMRDILSFAHSLTLNPFPPDLAPAGAHGVRKPPPPCGHQGPFVRAYDFNKS